MEVLCVHGYRDSVLLHKIADKLKDVKVTDINANDRVKVAHDFAFPIWPVLKIDGKPVYYGMRAVLSHIFNFQKLKPAEANKVDSIFSVADAIYFAACPLVVSKTIVVKKDLIAKKTAEIQGLFQIAQGLLDSSVASEYLIATLSIVKACGIEVPFAFEAFPTKPEILQDEMFGLAVGVLGIPERYAMAPKPEKPMYLSTPIYYVNGVPHFGHIFTTTLVESIANWYKIRGIDCIYSTGTDEHGLKVQTTAEANGVAPQAWCDKTSSQFRAAFEQFDLNPDVFIRTSDPKHVAVATRLWEILQANGYIYKGSYEGWYSKREECFIPENQIREEIIDGQKKVFNTEDGAELMWSSETNYMFKLSAMQEPLLDWLKHNPTCITPAPYYNQIKQMVKAGLRDISISRQNVSWGIPVPGDEAQTMYVWIDALANYLTVAGWDGHGSMGRWPCDIHTVGKDIIKFHAIYWPAFLIAAGVPCYKRLLVHGWWTANNEKMSKSLGNALDPFALTAYWGLEPLKYYVLREATLVSDSDYSSVAMLSRYNDLSNNLANLVMRIISVKLSEDLKVPAPGELQAADRDLIESIELLPGTVDHYIQYGQTRFALNAIFDDSLKSINKYLTDMKPWTLVKQDPERFKTVWYVLIETLRITVTCLKPFMPQTAREILNGLGATTPECSNPDVMFSYGVIKPGTQMVAVPVLFPRKELPE